MKTTQINVVCRKTVNYQAFEVSQTIELDGNETDDQRMEIIRKTQTELRKLVMEQINIEVANK